MLSAISEIITTSRRQVKRNGDIATGRKVGHMFILHFVWLTLECTSSAASFE
jgi:hypothetical protein